MEGNNINRGRMVLQYPNESDDNEYVDYEPGNEHAPHINRDILN